MLEDCTTMARILEPCFPTLRGSLLLTVVSKLVHEDMLFDLKRPVLLTCESSSFEYYDLNISAEDSHILSLCRMLLLVQPYPRLRSFLINPKCLLVGIDINLGFLPLASWYAALEHDVDLAIGSALHLRQAEVCCDQTHESGSAPDVAALRSNCAMSANAKSHYRGKTYYFRQWGLACTRRLFHVSFLTLARIRV